MSLRVSKTIACVRLNPNLQSLANLLQRVCFVAPDGTDSKKTDKWA